MRWTVVLAACAIGACSGLRYQAPDGTAAHVPSPETLPRSTQLVVALDGPIGTETSKPGDLFVATLPTAVTDERGTIAIPAGAKLYGRIIELRDGYGEEPVTVLLRVDAVSHDSRTAHVRARIVAIVGGPAAATIADAGAATLISLGTTSPGAQLPTGTRLVIETTEPTTVDF